LQELFPLGDYFVVNVSSPNTPELRDLQTRGYLEDLLGRLQEINRESSEHHGGPAKPLFVKIAPDLASAQLDDVVEAAVAAELAGIIATNTTVARGELPAEAREEQGGLSGKPLTDLSRRVIAAVYRRLEGRMPVIGVGGVMDFEAALQHIRAGASLLQLYTGLIYSGPGLPSSLCRKLEQLLQSRALQLVELVGVDAEEYADIA
jgi:dihydroorotate dehydrogenase